MVKAARVVKEDKKVQEADMLGPLNKIRSFSRQEYNRNKQKLIDYEAKNTSKIALIPCSGDQGWYEMAEQSALLYTFAVCEPLGIEKIIKTDEDSFYLQYKIGRLRTKNVADVRKNIQESKLLKQEVEQNGCIIFFLNKEYSWDDRSKMIMRVMMQRETEKAVIKMASIDPTLHQALSQLAGRVHQITPKFEKISGLTNGVRMVELADGALKDYYRICHAKYQVVPAEEWQKILEKIKELMVEIQVVAEVRIYTRRKMMDLGEMVVKLQEMLEALTKKSTKKLTKKEKGEK